jgi:hypothetical protein
LSDEKIHELAVRQPPLLRSMPFVIEMAGNKKPALLIFENGNYSLEDSNGEITHFEISGLDDPVEIAGPWTVSFPANLGAPAQVMLDKLISLHHHPDAGVKYFSGTALYINTFSFLNRRTAENKTFWLDLGRVEVIADVTLNDVRLGVLWKRPYRVDITSVLKEGANKLELRVTNLWPNRLIGDEQLPDPDKFTPGAGSSGSASVTGGAIEDLPQWYIEGRPKPANGRVTFATWKHFTKDSPLLESGLIGPVVLYTGVLESL